METRPLPEGPPPALVGDRACRSLVAGGAAYLTTADNSPLGIASLGAPAAHSSYSATTILWNPGAPIVGQGTPITSMNARQLVRRGMPAIAAKKLPAGSGLFELSSQVTSVADPVTGFLSITGTAKDPKNAEAISTASHKR